MRFELRSTTESLIDNVRTDLFRFYVKKSVYPIICEGKRRWINGNVDLAHDIFVCLVGSITGCIHSKMWKLDMSLMNALAFIMYDFYVHDLYKETHLFHWKIPFQQSSYSCNQSNLLSRAHKLTRIWFSIYMNVYVYVTHQLQSKYLFISFALEQ